MLAAAVLLAPLLLGNTGCARFVTKQTDTSPERVVVTKASAWTFFDSKSALSQFKATQTDKSQTATVGGLEQSGSGTNTVAALNAIATILQQVK